MKCVVIYFSQTGNTEKVARAIQRGMKQIAGHCDIFPIKEVNPRRLYEYDLIGLGSPVFDGAEPGNIRAFIGNMRFLGGKHIFSFCTHCTLGYAYNPSVIPKLKKKGLIVIGWNDWYGHNWGPPIQPTPYPTDGHPDEIDLKEAEAFGREMVWRSQRIYAGETSLIPEEPAPVPHPKPPDEALKFHTHDEFLADVKFDKDKCLYPECRLCMDNCPMDGIDLSVEPAILFKPCIHCFFCEQICPTGAIGLDIKRATEKMARFKKSIRQTGFKQLVKEEAQGHFRRLVKEEETGWDTPIFKVFNKHPRWIIGKGRP